MMLKDATLSDAGSIADIHRRARAKAMPWLPVVHTPEEDLWFFTNIVIPTQTVRVACFDNVVVGFAAFGEGWLNHLYVHPTHWRCGAGSKLLASAKGAEKQLELWTFQDNLGARSFYAAAGFEEVEFTDGAENEEKTPDLRMVWSSSV